MVEPDDILDARERLAPYIRPSPIIHSNHLSQRFGLEIYLKLENLQDTGSFKIRGALHHLLRLPKEILDRRVVAASAGNHAQGVAWAARQLDVCSTIFMPRTAPIAKLLATRSYGARVISKGDNYDEAAHEAAQWIQEHGGPLIPAFDDPHVITGQATVGLEILDQVPDVDSVIVPVGGGGLIAGVALAMKHANPDIEVLGVQSLEAPAMARSLEAGHRAVVASKVTMADGIAVAEPGEITFSIIQRLVDRVETVEEGDIESAVITFLERKNLLVEGAGATPLALLLEGRVRPQGRNVVLVVSGGNLDIQWLDRIIQRGALALGRRMRLRVLIPDVPGALSKITGIIAECGANILQVYHDRLAPEQPVYVSRVEFDLEIQGQDQAETIFRTLEDRGIQVMK